MGGSNACGYGSHWIGPHSDQGPVTPEFKQLQGPLFADYPEHRLFVWDAVAGAAFLRPEIVSDADGHTVLDVDQDRFWDLYATQIGKK